MLCVYALRNVPHTCYSSYMKVNSRLLYNFIGCFHSCPKFQKSQLSYSPRHSYYSMLLPSFKYLSSRNCSTGSKSNSSDSEETDSFLEEELEKKVLDAALSYVSTHGWTTDAIAKGKGGYTLR